MEKEGMNKTVVLKSILWLCLGIIFILPVFLIIMNAFKPNNDILTSFISFPKVYIWKIFLKQCGL